MRKRQEYELTKEEMDNLLKACNPPPVATRVTPGMTNPLTPQERANIAWTSLGKKRGFDASTVQPVPEKGQFFFTAVPLWGEVEDVEFKEIPNDQSGQAS